MEIIANGKSNEDKENMLSIIRIKNICEKKKKYVNSLDIQLSKSELWVKIYLVVKSMRF